MPNAGLKRGLGLLDIIPRLVQGGGPGSFLQKVGAGPGNSGMPGGLQWVSGISNQWNQDNNVWTNVSGTSFTAPGNQTATYYKGTKLQWTDSGGLKYGVVASSSFTSPSTTVTLCSTTDYSMASNPTPGSTFYSLGNPVNFPTSFAYAPTPTGFSANPTTSESWWALNNGFLTFFIWWLTGGTSNAATFTVPLPLSMAARFLIIPAPVMDNGTWVTTGIASLSGSTLTLGKVYPTAGGFTASGTKNVALYARMPI